MKIRQNDSLIPPQTSTYFVIIITLSLNILFVIILNRDDKMKKKILGIFIFMLIVIPILAQMAIADQETELDIEIVGGRKIRRKIYLIIRNIGNATAWNPYMEWRIDGGWIIGPRGYPFKMHSSMPPGVEETYMCFVPGRGLGRIEIIVTAYAANADTVNATVNGFIFGRFLILPDFVAYS